ncbi:hypothetical protein B2H86_15125 [Clostridium botulinum]|nr:hypothetical protein B2H86_15125 [Clostridium botulinum]
MVSLFFNLVYNSPFGSFIIRLFLCSASCNIFGKTYDLVLPVPAPPNTATFLLNLHVLNGKATILLFKAPHIMPSAFSSIFNISFIYL